MEHYEVRVTQAYPMSGGGGYRERWKGKQEVIINLPCMPYPGLQILDIGEYTGVWTVDNVMYGNKSQYIHITVK